MVLMSLQTLLNKMTNMVASQQESKWATVYRVTTMLELQHRLSAWTELQAKPLGGWGVCVCVGGGGG